MKPGGGATSGIDVAAAGVLTWDCAFCACLERRSLRRALLLGLLGAPEVDAEDGGGKGATGGAKEVGTPPLAENRIKAAVDMPPKDEAEPATALDDESDG